MEFRILGSFEVVGSAGALELPGAKRWGLLACLVTHAGQPMSTDQLVEELRGDGGSAGAHRTVQTYVSPLRKLLHGGSARLVSRPGGYLLDVDAADIDACRFERTVAAAGSEPDSAARLALLDEALDLWRGPPLVEFAGAGWADREAARLDGLHRQACSAATTPSWTWIVPGRRSRDWNCWCVYTPWTNGCGLSSCWRCIAVAGRPTP